MENFDDLIKIKTNNVKPAPGKILISEPFLYDYYFKRSVVLLAEHNNDGSFGVIINKPLSMSFEDVVKDFPDFRSKIFLGGPVSTNSLFFIHTLGELIHNSLKVTGGIYWGGDLEQVKTMITLGQLNENNIRFFIGYSGWSPKQLDMELKRDSWLVSELSDEQILSINPDDMWKSALQQLGDKYSQWINFPSDPGMN
ncbi:MAG TPA: YqgE/AlgH family protein [Bacteroidales bacterium]|nr:YqgE/AlgH family protein [Bacteroidales bacterium]HPR57805.1 YqgE/AlgH family protein [Bacteroidales bacterium]HRW96867.1 YqgE/AlgH family protein [Bacteroidales bacterium]